MRYVRHHSLGRLHNHLQRGRPALLFVHLGGSPRASRSADAMLLAKERLSGGNGAAPAVLVAAVDAATDPALARSLLSPSCELPAAVLLSSRSEPRTYDAPLNASTLVSEALAKLPGLPRVCTMKQLHAILGTATGRPRMATVLLHAAAAASVKEAVRVTSAANPSLVCASVTHDGARCLTTS